MKLLKNTRKKVVSLAVASAFVGVAAMSAPALAANVAQDGKGEVLLFPYYTVKNGFDTLLSVTNTSDRTVLFKIRFREAKNSREVRDFNVALSPHDIWTAGVTADGDGALVRTFDKSCTSPILPAGPNGSGQVGFTSLGYDGSDARYVYDNGGRNLSRVQEGYFEIIEMAYSTVPESSITSANTLEYATQHVAGVPRNCVAFDQSFAPLNLADARWTSFTAPANVLVGSSTLINVGSGKAFDASPTTIQSFRDVGTIIFEPGDLQPNLTDGDATVANFFVDGAPVVVTPTPVVVAASVEVVSALITANSVINEYASGGTETSGARTDWVVTFPTKHYYTDDPFATFTQLDVQPPFASAFQPTGQSCDPISLSLYDREEKTTVTLNQTQFSPPPSGPGGVSLCNEVNVMNFTNSSSPLNVFGSSVPLNVNTATVGSSGWASLNLRPSPLPSSWTATGLTGLPAIGFNAIERNNSVDAGNNRNYGSGQTHARTIVVAAP